MGVLLVIAIAIAIVFIIILIVRCKYKQEKKSGCAIQEIANRHGFTCTEVSDLEIEFKKFELFKTGHSKYFRNVLQKEQDNLIITQFDYSYITGYGINSSTNVQTATIFSKENLFNSHFILGPDGFWHIVSEMFGKNDINFKESPEFSKIYLLKGEDEISVRNLFSEEIRKFFYLKYLCYHKAYTIECHTDSLLVFMKNRVISADDFADVLKERIEIFEKICYCSAHS